MVAIAEAVRVRDMEGRKGLRINERTFIPHQLDERVLLDISGKPRYLYFPEDKAFHEIKAVVLNKETLNDTFDTIRETTRGSVFLKKSRMIPDQEE